MGYAPLAQLFGKPIVSAELSADGAYKLDPVILERAAEQAGPEQKLLNLNSPNNPTGALYGRSELEALAAVCRERDIVVLSDEIYALSTYDQAQFESMARVYPEGTFVVSGLSKFAGAGGYRVGVVVLPTTCTEEQRLAFRKIGAATYANTSTPIQHAAVAAFRDDAAVDRYIDDTRAIHEIVAGEVSRRLATIDGVTVHPPQGGFYLVADLSGLGEALGAIGLTTSAAVMEALIAHPTHLGVLAGSSLLLDPSDLRFRIAFVDYDGAAALAEYQREPPRSTAQQRTFFEAVAPRMVEGIERLRRWTSAVRAGDAITAGAQLAPAGSGDPP